MKKLILFAVLAFLAGSAQAQQTTVATPAGTQPGILNLNEAAAVTIDQQFTPLIEPAADVRVTNSGNTLRKTQYANNDLFEIGLMANTYAMIGESRTQVACDPKTNQVAVIFRGNDRSSSGDGNTLYIRYSNDHGATWSSQGDNIATSPAPRYPNVFLPNDGSGANTSVLWPQVTQFGNGSEGFGEVYAMKSDIGNGNPSYSQISTPPNWSIPSSIVMDQSTGDLFSMAMAVEPSNGEGTGEYYVLRSQDDGASWAPVTFDNPAFTGDLVPQGYFASNLRLDISPDGSTMIAAFALIIESEPGRAFLLDENHEVAWRISTDKGATWGELQRMRPADLTNKPDPFNAKFSMAWDFDLIIDHNNRPHFLTVCSADLNPFSPFDEAPTDSTISLIHVDSTFATEFTIDDEQNWQMYPIGPVLRVRTDRQSFTAASQDDAAYVFRNEPKWARSYDGKKIYAKWISPLRTWTIANVAGQPTLFADTIHQIYVNGRMVDNPADKPGWTYDWDFANPMANTVAMDSVMRITNLEEVDAKFTKLAHYAGDEGELHIIFTEWGIGETLDDDPLFTDQVVWYVQNVTVPTMPSSVEQLDATPGDFDLAQNFPNPFNPSTEITFTLPKAAQVSLRVFNLLGQEVATLVDEYRTAGTHRTTFDAQNLPSGMYIYRLESGAQSVSRRMMLSK